jgi:uncharacterized membrane protein YdbT with pleckstrin-like domain
MRSIESPWVRGFVNAVIWVVVSVVVYTLLFDDTLLRAVLIGLAGGVAYAVAFERFRPQMRTTSEN